MVDIKVPEKNKGLFFFYYFFFFYSSHQMYPGVPRSEHEQFPLHDTQFSYQPPVHNTPFGDTYQEEQPQPFYDNQPLLTSPPYPPVHRPPNPAVGSPYPPYQNPGPPSPGIPGNLNPLPPSPTMHYGQAPRRQPRRYKTSKKKI